MDDKDKMLDKIKKCLALGKSSNEHEAAAALRQAKALMEKHGVSDLDMAAAEASERRARAGATRTPANWETALASRISDAFGCRILFSYNPRKDCGEWVFIGTGAAPEIADYAFRVLFRQAKNARAQHIKGLLKRCKAASKVRRADLFCESWVHAVASTISKFSGGDDNSGAIDAYTSKRYPALKSLNSRDRNGDRSLRNHDYNDLTAGAAAGRSAKLHRGVDGSRSTLSLEGKVYG